MSRIEDLPRCAQCSLEELGSLRYVTNSRGQKLCYTCCANENRAEMMRSGRITLYLSWFDDKEWAATKVLHDGLTEAARYKITNCVGSLVIQPFHVRVGRSYYDSCRHYVYFVGPDGYEWYGKHAGHGQLLHCKRKKEQSLSFGGVVWTSRDGRQTPLWQMERGHLSNSIEMITRNLTAESPATRKWAKLRESYVEPMRKIYDIKTQRGDPWRDLGSAETISDDVLQLEITQ